MDLRVRLARTLVEALAYDLATARDNATDTRIGRRGVQPALGEPQRASHVGVVGGSEHPCLVIRGSWFAIRNCY
jgi:hypothetical protein